MALKYAKKGDGTKATQPAVEPAEEYQPAQSEPCHAARKRIKELEDMQLGKT